jgi:multisubunit Na+/H+ antiporter MnhC subunit
MVLFFIITRAQAAYLVVELKKNEMKRLFAIRFISAGCLLLAVMLGLRRY